MDRIWIIDGVEFTPKPFSQIKFKDSDYVDKCMNIKQSGKEVKLNIEPSKIFPIILKPTDKFKDADLSKIDWEDMCFDDVFDIVSEYVVRKQDFFANMPGYLKNLAQEKVKLITSTQKNTESRTSTNRKRK